MSPRETAKRELKAAGYYLDRHGSSHDIFFNAELNCTIPLKRHDFNDNDLKYIKKEIRENKIKRR